MESRSRGFTGLASLRRQHAQFFRHRDRAVSSPAAGPNEVDSGKRPRSWPSWPPQNPLARTENDDNSKTQTLSALGHGAQAGLPYGTLNRGQLYGEEIRPALPVTTSDPVAYPWELPDSEGNVVVEITD